MEEVKVLLFIPMYNCELQIPRVIEKLQPYKDYFSRALIVDNQSNDGSINAAVDTINQEKLTDQIFVARNKENLSLGGSHKVAFNYAIEHNYTHVLVLHGDDQANINDIHRFLEDNSAFRYSAFLGARFHPDSKLKGYSKFRIFGNRAFNKLCTIALGSKIHDMNAGINMYSVELLRRSRYNLLPDDLTFNTHHLFEHFYNKENICFFPITWTEEDQISNAKVFKQAFRILKFLIYYITNKDPFKLNKSTHENYETEVLQCSNQ